MRLSLKTTIPNFIVNILNKEYLKWPTKKKTKPFHITITHGEDIITDIDTNGILAAVHTENEEEHGGTAVHLLTACNPIALMGLIRGAKTASNQVIDSLTEKGLGKFALLSLLKDAIEDK